ncbi:PepSY domain-containing protein [Kocuria sp. CPCC 205261]|uniref:PepSY domain-containing protein n=1 Tax=Kocuria sp. CPCC 205261 TaxID=3073554 RepID=UPI0034D4556D
MFFNVLALVVPALVSCHAPRPVPLAYLLPPCAWSPVRAPPTPGSWPCCKDCTLPLRTTIDRLHRHLLLGEPGRLYSELAASWLGVMAVSRIVLMVLHRRRVGRGRCARVTLVPRPGEANAYRRTRSCHTATGVWLALDFLFLAASGLTWSAHAGENVSQLRSALHWTAPKVSTALPGSAQRQGVGDEHAEHRGRGFRPRTPTAVRCCSWWVSAWGCSCRCWASRSWRCSRRISRSPSSHNAAWPGNPRTDHSCGRCSPNGPRRLNGCRSLHEQHP